MVAVLSPASPAGFEGERSTSQGGVIVETAQKAAPADPPLSAIVGPIGQSRGNEPPPDPVEGALADALTHAAEALAVATALGDLGRAARITADCATLSRELTARREARAGVVDFAAERKRRGQP